MTTAHTQDNDTEIEVTTTTDPLLRPAPSLEHILFPPPVSVFDEIVLPVRRRPVPQPEVVVPSAPVVDQVATPEAGEVDEVVEPAPKPKRTPARQPSRRAARTLRSAPEAMEPEPETAPEPEPQPQPTVSVMDSIESMDIEEVARRVVMRMHEAEAASLRHLAALDDTADRHAELVVAQAELDAELILLHARREAHALVSGAHDRRERPASAKSPAQRAELDARLAEIEDTFGRFIDAIDGSSARVTEFPRGRRRT